MNNISLRQINIKAIVYGLIADLLTSLLAGIILSFFVRIESTAYFVNSLIFGLIAIVIGGYVSANYSPVKKMLNAFVFGVIVIIFSLFLFPYVTSSPSWFVVSSIVLSLPSALLGAHLSLKKD